MKPVPVYIERRLDLSELRKRKHQAQRTIDANQTKLKMKIVRYFVVTCDIERRILPDPAHVDQLDLWCDANLVGDCVKRKSTS